MDEPIERPMIVLGCNHLVDRPMTTAATIHCQCGRSWKLRLEAGGKTWVAEEVTRR